MKKIPLTGRRGQGKFAIVDDEDYEKVTKYRWFLKDRAVSTNIKDEQGKHRKVSMHRYILNPPTDKVVDHIDRDILNNTRSNLRICTQKENTLNRPASKGNSEYKGVSFSKFHKKFVAYISLDGKRKHIGYFEKEKEAAQAYDYYAIRMFGEFAYLNFPNETPTKPEGRTLSSKYRGVSWIKKDKRFLAAFQYNGVRYRVGYFVDEEEAAKAYNEKVKEVMGKDAHKKMIELEDFTYE